MNTPSLRLSVLLLAFMAVTAGGQNQDRAPFQPRDNYEEARFGSGDVTIKTRDGARKLHISLSRLRVAQTARPAVIRWTGPGLALLQHGAGAAKIAIGKERFEPLEGEWLRVPLPAEFTIGTDNDTILLDVILVEEK